MQRLSYLIAWITLCAFGLFPTGIQNPITQPMCAVISGGCADAWGVAEAAAPGYSGPLFQLYNTATTMTLNIGQTPTGKADMTTWTAFCGGTNTTLNGIVTNSNCKILVIYSEIQGSANDIIPSVFVGSGVDCSMGGPTFCACPFRYEVATGLPILYKTTEMCEYTLTGDNPAMGINSGMSNTSVIVNGLPNTTQLQCCSIFGLYHKYNAPDTQGTDFGMVIAWGDDMGVGVPCDNINTFTCFGPEYELAATLVNYTVPNPANLFAVMQKTSTNTVSAWLNGTEVISGDTPGFGVIDSGTSIHLGGGGDLSQPSSPAMREWAITNSAVSQTDVNAALNQIKINFPTLGFGAPVVFSPL